MKETIYYMTYSVFFHVVLRQKDLIRSSHLFFRIVKLFYLVLGRRRRVNDLFVMLGWDSRPLKR